MAFQIPFLDADFQILRKLRKQIGSGSLLMCRPNFAACFYHKGKTRNKV